MRCFAISCVLAFLGILLGSLILHWSAISFHSIDSDIFALLSIVFPCLGISLGCVFLTKEDWGNSFSAKNISYSFVGALFATLGWYIGFIVIARALSSKQFGAFDVSFLMQFFNPSLLPTILEKEPSGIVKEIQPTLGRCAIAFFVGLIGTGYNISYFWNNYGIKRQPDKRTVESPCLVCDSPGFLRGYEHRIFYTVGVVSQSKSYLFHFPFCDRCWANISSKIFYILKALVLLGMFGGIFGILYFFDKYNLLTQHDGLLSLSLLGLPAITFVLYQYIKRCENKHRSFRIDSIDKSGNIKISVFNQEKKVWDEKILFCEKTMSQPKIKAET